MAAETNYRAGVAGAVITPSEPMWAAGYAHRDRPTADKAGGLYAKALALEDGRGKRLVIVTTDLLGLPKTMVEPVARNIGRRFGLGREQILLTSSHTHSGPVLGGSLVDMYPMGPDEWTKVERYSAWLEPKLVEVVAGAMDDLAPAELSRGVGQARFGANRREFVADQGVILGYNPHGPVDHDVPVLQVTAGDGAVRAVLFSYACHGTTLREYEWCGDYPGFAQANLEASRPGAQAMFVAGCGADVNPFPRGNLELCRKHGQALADAVDRVLADEMTPMAGSFAAAFERVDLPFDQLPTRAELQRRRDEGELFEKRGATRLLAQLDAGQPLPPSYAYPIQVLRLGNDLTVVALAGEVVVSYSRRLKDKLGPADTWVIAYANEVFAYIPSRQMLTEGGYEPDTSVAVYGLPARWAPAAEEIVVAGACDLANRVRAAE